MTINKQSGVMPPEAAGRFCMRCGQFMGDREGARFCPRCGIKQTVMPIKLEPEPAKPLVPPLPLAGFQYYEGAVLWSEIEIGDTLTLVPEPDNRYDRWAVEIYWRGTHKLGYVPRYVSEAVFKLLADGEPLEAWICQKRKGKSVGYHSVQFQLNLPMGHQLWKHAM